MKILWLNAFLTFLLCSAFVGCTQSTPSPTSAANATPTLDSKDPILLPVKVSGKWGYVNTSGQLVINPQFDNANEFHEGRASVCLGTPCSWWISDTDKLDNSHWGYIDTSGKMVISPQYPSAGDFNEGLALLCGC